MFFHAWEPLLRLRLQKWWPRVNTGTGLPGFDVLIRQIIAGEIPQGAFYMLAHQFKIPSSNRRKSLLNFAHSYAELSSNHGAV